jgi:hypothetical protein
MPVGATLPAPLTMHSFQGGNMASKNLSKTSAEIPQKPKQTLSPEILEEIASIQKRIARVSKMAEGVHGFCSSIDPGREDLQEFSFAISIFADMLREDSAIASENLKELIQGGGN